MKINIGLMRLPFQYDDGDFFVDAAPRRLLTAYNTIACALTLTDCPDVAHDSPCR